MTSRMRRKLGINVAPLDKALRQTLDPDQLSPPPQPLSLRNPPLSPKTEYQLRQACAALGRDSKPSGSGLNPPPQRLPRSKGEKSHARSGSDVQHSESEGALTDFEMLEPSKFSYKPDADLKDLLGEPVGSTQAAPANIGRRREPMGLSTEGPRPKGRQKSFTAPTAPDLIRPSDARTKTSAHAEPCDTATSTPHTGSSDMAWANSTAPTSEAITPARSSNRGSNQHVLSEQEVSSRTDEAAAEWLRIERDKRKDQESRRDVQSKTQTPAPVPYTAGVTERPPSRARSTSRARSIKDAVQNYIRPGAPSGSRSSSRESFRSQKSNRRRSPTAGRWRSWSLTRNKSTRHESRPGSRDGRPSGRDESNRGRSTTKPEINLNRELPPLPSLDNWQEPEPEPEPTTPSTHIASLMRPGADSQHARPRPAIGSASGSQPQSPIELPPHELPLHPRVAHRRNHSDHVQTIVSPHPPRSSSRQGNHEYTRHTPIQPLPAPDSASFPRSTPMSKSSAPPAQNMPTTSTKSRGQSLVSRIRSASQSSLKAPSIPLVPSRPGTGIPVRQSNDLDRDDPVPRKSIDVTKAAWGNQSLQRGEDIYALTQTKTVGLTNGLAATFHRPAGEDALLDGEAVNGKVTGLRKRSATGGPQMTNALTSPSRELHSSSGTSNAHSLKRQISSDLRRDGTVTPWEYAGKEPPIPHLDEDRGRKKNTDLRNGETTRLRSKFARFFSSTTSNAAAPAKQKPKKGGDWASTFDALQRHTGRRSQDAEDDSAPPPRIGY
ncbi:MAG: hypothetical protein Q9165_006543 [Trypethelium subeluteriae]